MPTPAPDPFFPLDFWQVAGVVIGCAFLSQLVRIGASGYRVPWDLRLYRSLASSLTAMVAYGIITVIRPDGLGFWPTCALSVGVGWVGSSLMYPLTRIALERTGIQVPDDAREAQREVKQ